LLFDHFAVGNRHAVGTPRRLAKQPLIVRRCHQRARLTIERARLADPVRLERTV
jgi:hypothetical protein